MKYNVPLEIKENDSLSMLLKKIRPNSDVLEFGCANGRMTQYMKEQLGCKVYIVEYEKEAFEEATMFAEGGICSDIMKFEWKTVFNLKFDYIIFADVLEHLSDPQKVTEETKDILKEDGSLLVSVPNVGHNDIIIKLLQEKFEYTDIGLLDDTHIHFFALNSIKAFFENSGYGITDFMYTVIPTGNTEQFRKVNCKIDSILRNILQARPSGEIYQFIICARKGVESQDVINIDASIQCKIYCDRGKGFNESDVVYVKALEKGDRVYQINQILYLPKGTRKIRIDFIEGQGCIVFDAEIMSDRDLAKIHYSSNINILDGVILLGEDPFIEVEWEKENAVSLNCNIIFQLAGEEYIRNLVKGMLEIQDKYLNERNKYIIERDSVAEKERMVQELQLMLSDNRAIIRMREREIDAVIAKGANELKKLEQQNNELRKMEQEYNELRKIEQEYNELKKIEQQYNELLSQKHALEERLYHIENMKIWRIAKRVKKVFKKFV